jgi:hypothetical protein
MSGYALKLKDLYEPFIFFDYNGTRYTHCATDNISVDSDIPKSCIYEEFDEFNLCGYNPSYVGEESNLRDFLIGIFDLAILALAVFIFA